MYLTNFKNSYIGWDDTSSGRFNLVSILKIKYKFKQDEIFGLGEAVLACNVYQKKKIIKVPTYLFQLIGSKNKQKILRTDIKNNLSSKRYQIKDSNLTSLFKNFYLEIDKLNLKKISITQIDKDFVLRKNICAKINFFGPNNSEFQIEFPINHTNYHDMMSSWHIETGPILMPVINSLGYLTNLSPCFISFNTLNYFEIFSDYPFGKRNITMKKTLELPYKLNLYKY